MLKKNCKTIRAS